MDAIIFNFNELDLAVLSIVLLSGIFSYIRGFSWEIANLFSWILTLTAVWYLSWVAGPWVGALMTVYLGWSLPYFIVVGLAGILIFLAMTIALGPIMGRVMKGSLNLQVGFTDRFLGFLYGGARGLFLMTLIFLAYAWLVAEADYPAFVEEAQFFMVLKELADFIKSIFTNG